MDRAHGEMLRWEDLAVALALRGVRIYTGDKSEGLSYAMWSGLRPVVCVSDEDLHLDELRAVYLIELDKAREIVHDLGFDEIVLRPPTVEPLRIASASTP